jgi:ABC-type oligopeptide transport system ATPase subunit
VGVIGRTGSGKSSFLSAVLRLNDVVGGDILVSDQHEHKLVLSC